MITNNSKKGLMFLIDSTGSMGSWIAALNGTLPLLVRSIALTNIFDDISVMTYGDYDYKENEICKFSGFCDCSNILDVNMLQKFTESIRSSGGGGHAEAWKTSLTKIMETKYFGHLYIIHLTDAPPHTNHASLDTEGKKEKKKLDTRFDYVCLYNDFINQIKNFRYVCLTTSPHQLYCHFAQMSNGFVHKIKQSITIANIRKSISNVLNTLLNLSDPITNYEYINLDLINMHYGDERELCCLNICHKEEIPVRDMMLTNILTQTVNKMRFDNIFQERVISELEKIITSDLLALTVSPILGKLWREFCKRRSDVRRDTLIKLLKKCKNKLSTDDAQYVDNWLIESYNAESEINDKLYKFMSENETMGLIRFIPEDTKLLSRQIVQLLASGSKRNIQTIREILARIMIDKEFHHSKILEQQNQSCNSSTDKSPVCEQDQLHLPINSIPLNLPVYNIFEFLMHTVTPGTNLTKRYSAIIALHIIQCDNILSEYAHIFLEKIRGTWINWKRRKEDNTPEIPECFSSHFLDLILHKKCEFALTPEELETAKYYKSVSYLLKFYHSLEINVKIIDSTSVDGFFPDHYVNCTACGIDRPLSLIRKDGLCGYEPHNLDINQTNESINTCTTDSLEKIDRYIQVRCYLCGSIYARNADAIVVGHSKCHGCRNVRIPSPSVQCSECKLKIVQFYNPENGLPGGKCGACADGCNARNIQLIEHHALAHNVFDEYFSFLCKNLGFYVSKPIKNIALYDALLHISKCKPIITEPPTNAFFREKNVQNIPELWKYMLKIMSGGEVELSECAVCLENMNSSMLVPACGRKGCSQRVCIECNKSWYGKNKLGGLIYPRATMCQFCSRIPAPKILCKIDIGLNTLAYAGIKLDPDLYYGWCKSCGKTNEVAERKCISEPPTLTNYECSCCINKSSITIKTKDCPGCTVSIEKISGCNHIECKSCGVHWCWECSLKCDSSKNVYNHMWSVHKRIFDTETPHNPAEDEDDTLNFI